MKKNLTIEEAERLLEKYYDGATTRAEEALLQEFLQNEDLPQQFMAERAIFGFFATEKAKSALSDEVLNVIEMPAHSQDIPDMVELPPQTRVIRLSTVLKVSFAAAVLLFGVLILDNRMQAQNGNVAYVDGIRYTDSKSVKALAIASIQNIDLGADEVAGTVNNMNDANLVESQLQQFPELK